MNNKSLEYYLNLNYPITLYPEETGYTVEIKDLPGCISQGNNIEEALFMINDAKQLWIVVSLASGWEIPEPSQIDENRQLTREQSELIYVTIKAFVDECSQHDIQSYLESEGFDMVDLHKRLKIGREILTVFS